MRAGPPRSLPTSLAAALVLAACGGDATGPGVDGGSFQASIDGTAWQATSAVAQGASPGTFTLAGSDASGVGLSLVLFNIGAPGTYPLGVGPSVFGGTATLTQGASSWWTPLSGGAGTVTVTRVSGTRLTGTFSLTAVPLGTGTMGSRAIADGAFDVAVVASGSVDVPPNMGHRFGGTLGGRPWDAATVVGVTNPASANGVFVAAFSNDTHRINLIVSGYGGAGTYNLNTDIARYFGVDLVGTTTQWGGTQASNSGSVVISSSTAARIVGSFNATLQPSAGNPTAGTLSLSGTFDLGIQ